MLRQEAQLHQLCGIAHRDAAWFHDFAEDAKRDVLLARLVRRKLAVARDRAERVEVRNTRFGVLGRDRATTDVVAEADERVADPELTFDPALLLVRLTIVQLEEHAEAASVDGLGLARVTRELEK